MSKLVRDFIPKVIPADKQHLYKFSVVEDKEEYSKLLKNKLVEEVNEYLEDENEQEIADILEVLDAIMKLKNFNKEKVLTIKEAKKLERGGFEKQILMEYTK
jgi:predicted house-cleaning noncanonical NTP pyrophosphatase (MazG superfamily)